MTDLTAKLREALPCLAVRWSVLREKNEECDGGCRNCLARAKVEAVVREMIAGVDEERTPLHWFDEGAGYQHAHESMPCDERQAVADFVLEPSRTAVSVTLPAMSEREARKIAEQLHAHAIRALAGEKGTNNG